MQYSINTTAVQSAKHVSVGVVRDKGFLYYQTACRPYAPEKEAKSHLKMLF